MTDNNKIYESMNKILNQVGSISKEKKAEYNGKLAYKFRGIDDMYNTLHQHFAENNVFVIPEVISTEMTIQDITSEYNGNVTVKHSYSCVVTMKFHFFADDGSSVTATGVGHAIDNSDKATNKAQSSAFKYCLMQTFLIPTSDEKDVETQNNPVVKNTPKQINLTSAKMIEIMSTNDIEKAKKVLATKEIKGIPFVISEEQKTQLEELINNNQ